MGVGFSCGGGLVKPLKAQCGCKRPGSRGVSQVAAKEYQTTHNASIAETAGTAP